MSKLLAVRRRNHSKFLQFRFDPIDKVADICIHAWNVWTSASKTIRIDTDLIKWKPAIFMFGQHHWSTWIALATYWTSFKFTISKAQALYTFTCLSILKLTVFPAGLEPSTQYNIAELNVFNDSAIVRILLFAFRIWNNWHLDLLQNVSLSSLLLCVPPTCDEGITSNQTTTINVSAVGNISAVWQANWCYAICRCRFNEKYSTKSPFY